jgi:hypothetical protein
MNPRPADDPAAPVPFTAEDVDGAAMVLRLAGQGRAELLVALTDEQLAALDGDQRIQFTATPWLDQQPEQRGFAAHVGLRALLAAGRVREVTVAGSGEPRWQAAPDIAGCLVLRRTATRFTTAERTVQTEQGPQVHRLHHYVHDSGVLEEEVTAAGIHRFTPVRADQVAARLVAVVDPASVASAGEDPVRVRASELAAGPLAATLAGTRALTVLTVVRTADGTVQQISASATDDQVLTLEALDPSADDPELELRRVDRADLHALASTLVGNTGRG